MQMENSSCWSRIRRNPWTPPKLSPSAKNPKAAAPGPPTRPAIPAASANDVSRPVTQSEANLASFQSLSKPPPLLRRLQDQWRHRLRKPGVLIYRHKRHISRRGVLPLLGHGIF